jgi:hypothetical protein
MRRVIPTPPCLRAPSEVMSRIVRSRSADRQRIVLRHAASTTQHVASGFGETCEVTLAKDVSANNQRLCLDGSRVAQMSDTQPPHLNSAAVGIGRHVSGIADPFNGHIDEFRISHIQRSDGWIETTWSNMSDQVLSQRQGQKRKTAEAASRYRWPAPVWWSV